MQPGLVAGLIPYWLGGSVWEKRLYHGITPAGYPGLISFCAGFAILIACVMQFGLQGRGTLSPLDPTRRLVTQGLYAYSRNPMYIGVLLILTGESLVADLPALWIYTACVFAGFHLFIKFHEEPRLRKAFGNAYSAYCSKVSRWI